MVMILGTPLLTVETLYFSIEKASRKMASPLSKVLSNLLERGLADFDVAFLDEEEFMPEPGVEDI
jgi:hypothetical protein